MLKNIVTAMHVCPVLCILFLSSVNDNKDHSYSLLKRVLSGTLFLFSDQFEKTFPHSPICQLFLSWHSGELSEVWLPGEQVEICVQVVYWVVLWESAHNDPIRNSGAGMAVGRGGLLGRVAPFRQGQWTVTGEGLSCEHPQPTLLAVEGGGRGGWWAVRASASSRDLGRITAILCLSQVTAP